MGHIFEHRILPVSDDNGSATRPLVAVRGRRLVMAWVPGDTGDTGDAGAAPAALAVRVGTVR